MNLLLVIIASISANLGPGPVSCDLVNNCGAGRTCCATPGGDAGNWGCCAAPNATCCGTTCCPSDFPICGPAGQCAKSKEDTWKQFSPSGLGRAPPPPPPPTLFPYECKIKPIGCYSEFPGRPTTDGWPENQRRSAGRGNIMPWGAMMSVEQCVLYCHQNMENYTDGRVVSGWNVTIAGQGLCGCSSGVPAANQTTRLPEKVDDALCNAPCPINGTYGGTCGDANQTVVTAYAYECTAPLAAPRPSIEAS